jgi:hypothetical protein
MRGEANDHRTLIPWPLTPTLSPQAGRGSRQVHLKDFT